MFEEIARRQGCAVAAERSWRQAVIDAAPVALVLALCPLVATMAPGPAGPVERAAT